MKFFTGSSVLWFNMSFSPGINIGKTVIDEFHSMQARIYLRLWLNNYPVLLPFVPFQSVTRVWNCWNRNIEENNYKVMMWTYYKPSRCRKDIGYWCSARRVYSADRFLAAKKGAFPIDTFAADTDVLSFTHREEFRSPYRSLSRLDECTFWDI